MKDITERLRDAATIHVQLAGQSALATTIRDGAEEIDRLRARVAELEAARGEPVAYLHQVVCGDGEPDQALSFAPDNFPLAGALGYRSLSHEPLYTAPRVDVDAISDEAIERGWMSWTGGLVIPKQTTSMYAERMRAALRAVFNNGE